ncbi:FAD-binding oxidoreductase [Streptomyces sp. TRM 70361]|uniref:FAD-binding oxidoreductase n=1 Tax=Streptomyces sp. TRM 70361 TaxID=3116553 RepID=UPI002E7B5FA0|nr:FAD-binding oxidoreductase [Streptomyces sp. TRM 70361]MEE1939582.1 FAD-binding oxidoreductase [Streptomyces sp. TRM 70361]
MTTALRKRLESLAPERVVTPGHPRYDTLRSLFNGAHDRRPAVIFMPLDGREIAAAVDAGRDAGLRVTVRGGGHNVAGSASNDDGLVIDLRLMRRVTVDPGLRLARVQGGATWNDVDNATARYGLATTGGTVGSTGVAGLTLGGGLGYLSRSLGLTCDLVRSYRLVTGDGQRREVDAERDPELNRLLRGAGHGLGAVEEFTFRLAPVTRVHGGRFVYPLRYASRVTAAFTELMADAPPELTCLLLLEPWGDPPVRSVVANVCYTGDDPAVVDRVRRVMSCAPPTAREFAPRSYLSMQASLGETDFGLRHYWSTCSVTAFPEELAGELAERYAAGGCGGAGEAGDDENIVIVTPLGGAVATPEEPGAIAFRDAAYTVLAMGIWRDPARDEAGREWARGIVRAARPWSLDGDQHVDYVNYASDPAERGRPGRAPGETHRALQAVRRRLDPDGVFGPVLPDTPVPVPA